MLPEGEVVEITLWKDKVQEVGFYITGLLGYTIRYMTLFHILNISMLFDTIAFSKTLLLLWICSTFDRSRSHT